MVAIYAWSSVKTRSAVIGIVRTRAPQAAKTAFAIAGATPGVLISPTAFAPKGPGPPPDGTSTVRSGGQSACDGSL